MNHVILIHGMPDKNEVLEDVWPSPSNSHFLPWIQKQLTRTDILCQTLEMPRSYDPVYKDHERVFKQMEISDETIVVGHSAGAGFLIRYLSEHQSLQPKKIIVVAPWLDLEGYLQTINPQSDYFDFTIDTVLGHRIPVVCMYSTDDEQGVIDTVVTIKNEIPGVQYVTFHDKGHFTEPDLGTKEFPELLEEILK